MGNWDHAGAWASLVRRRRFTTVAERLRPESLYERFVAYREGLGMEVLPLTGGDGDLLDMLRQRLRAGRLVCLLADRDLRAQRRRRSSFFGEPTRMPAGPAVLALRTGAALLPVSSGTTTAGARRAPAGHPVPRRGPAARPRAHAGEGRRDDPGRWPTCSARRSPSTPRTGTCCSRSGSPTSTRHGRTA